MNNKNYKVITINGIVALAIAIVVVLTAIIAALWFPVLIIKEFWNYFITDFISLPEIGYIQAFLLWLAGTLTIFIFIKNRIKISFQSYKGDGDTDFDSILKELSGDNDTEEEDIKDKH